MLIWVGSLQRSSRKFLLLDRDGVINPDRPDYIKCWSEYEFYQGSLEALRFLRERDVRVIVLSNQSGLNRGFIAWGDFRHIHEQMVQGIRDAGGDIAAALYCPHRPDEGCACRKPLPGMIHAASRLFEIPLRSTYMVGDRMTDVEAASQAGALPILLKSESKASGGSVDALSLPGRCFPTLLKAVRVLGEEGNW